MIDQFLDRRRSATYNCYDFVREVWLKLYGENIGSMLTDDNRIKPSTVKTFKRLEAPVSPCFVMLYRAGFPPHVGIYIDGRLLHLHTHGVEFLPLNVTKRYFNTVRYYR